MTEWAWRPLRALEYVSATSVWALQWHATSPDPLDPVRDPSGERDPQAFLCTDLDLDPVAILSSFVFRWRIETTFQRFASNWASRRNGGGPILAILRTTPALLGLYSLVAIWAHGLMADPKTAVRTHSAAWAR